MAEKKKDGNERRSWVKPASWSDQYGDPCAYRRTYLLLVIVQALGWSKEKRFFFLINRRRGKDLDPQSIQEPCTKEIFIHSWRRGGRVVQGAATPNKLKHYDAVYFRVGVGSNPSLSLLFFWFFSFISLLSYSLFLFSSFQGINNEITL